MSRKSRRRFLEQSLGASAAVAGLTLTSKADSSRDYSVDPSATSIDAISQDRVAGANRRIRVGLIGCGGQGTGDLRKMLLLPNVECVALCDVDDNQVSKAADGIKKTFNQTPALRTRDFRKLIEQKEIDAVIVGTPDHWHALTTITACQAGKDVYVEKPLSLTIAEGRVMVDVARRHNRVVQMGTQQRNSTHYKDAVEYVNSGLLGKIRVVRTWAYQDWMGNVPVAPDSDPPPGVDYDMWLGPAPKRPFNKNRFHFNFRWYYDYSGGLMTDWGAHMIDIANWAMGIKAPKSAMSVGGKFGFPEDAEETPDTQQALWDCGGYSMIWEHATFIGRGPETRDHGVSFIGNNGTLTVDRGGWEVHPETEGTAKRKQYKKTATMLPRQGSGGVDYHALHIKNFVDCMDSRKQPNSDVEIGHNSMIACHLGNVAFRTGRVIHWDIERERVINDADAQKLIDKPYRAPWKLPALS